MSTVPRRNLRRTRPVPANQADAAPPRTGRRRTIAVIAAIVLLCVWFAPALVAHTPLLNMLVRSATADLDGTVTVGGASLGWLSPVAARDVQIHDADGEAVLDCPRVEVERTLLGLLFDSSQLGQVTIESPNVQLALRSDGSNLEDVLAPLMMQESESSTPVAAQITASDAHINITDRTNDRTWSMAVPTFTVGLLEESGPPVVVDLSAKLESGGTPGNVELHATATPSTGASHDTGGAATAEVRAAGFPLELVQAVLQRVAPGFEAHGTLDGDVKIEFGPPAADGRPRGFVEGELQAADLTLAGGWLGEDRLQLGQLDVPCRVKWEADQLQIEQLGVTCDVGQFSCAATIDEVERLLSAGTVAAAIGPISRATGHVEGRIDMAALAATLPRTMRLRDETNIESGQIAMSFNSRAEHEGLAWEGRLDASQLVAVHAGQVVRWDRPVSVDLAAHQTATGPIVDRLRWESDFARLEGTGTLGSYHVSADFDLRRLAAQVEQVIDLGQLRLAGSGAGELNWRSQPGGAFQSDLSLQANQLALALGDASPWTEDRLAVSASISGLWNTGSPPRFDRANVRLATGRDQVTAELTEPVAAVDRQTAWPLAIEARGRLGPLVERLATWSGPLDPWQFDGEFLLSTAGRFHADRVEIEQLSLDMGQAHVWGPGVYVDEPSLRLAATGGWTTADRTLRLTKATFATPSASGRFEDAVVVLHAGSPPDVTGALVFAGDLQHLQRWMSDPRERLTREYSGRLQGRAELTRDESAARFSCESMVEQFAVASAGQSTWYEPRLHFATSGGYVNRDDRLDVETLDVVGDAIQLEAKAKIERLSTDREMRIEGTANYDLEKITRLLAPRFGRSVTLTGRESHAFWIAGKLPADAPQPTEPNAEGVWLRQLSGEADFGWQGIDLLGLPIGTAKVQARLADGTVAFDPFDVSVSQGRVRLTSQMRVAPEPATMFVEPGQLVEKVRITPELCNRSLMYVAPVLAGVTEAQGQFSITLDQRGQVPLANPKMADLSGKLNVHSIEVGPGPLVRELAILMGRPSAARLAKESQVSFRMTGGRVYHRDLQLVFPELTIVTSGSVGLDQSLDLVARMPVPPKWLGNNPLGDALRNRTIELPIRGTITRPAIDQKAMESLAAQFMRQATDDLLRQGLEQGLNRLLGPPR